MHVQKDKVALGTSICEAIHFPESDSEINV